LAWRCELRAQVYACTSSFGLITIDQLLELLDARPETVELVLTGRYCPEAVLERADLITEMREVRHYYTRGVLARKGIES
jgi:cob(I)alamin adenosyltransferase